MSSEEQQYLEGILALAEDTSSSDEDAEQDDENGSGSGLGQVGSLPGLMGRADARRMMLTTEEHYFALEIKQAIEATPEIDNLSDFMYAQFALICKANVNDAVNRAKSLQGFKTEHGITDSYEEGCREIEEVAQLLPNLVLFFGFSHSDGCYVMVHDSVQIDAGVLNTASKTSTCFANTYYHVHAACPDLESVRKGFICVTECEGMSWAEKDTFKLLLKLASGLMSSYPCFGICMHYHTSTAFNIVASLAKKAFPAGVRHTFQQGLNCDCRLDSIFFVPSRQVAAQKRLQSVKKALKLRFENERSFSLADSSYLVGGS